jgi:hypothetical protein
MAHRADRYQVLRGVFTSVAAELLMVDFQIRHRAAQLTAPAVSAQHFMSQILVGDRIKP